VAAHFSVLEREMEIPGKSTTKINNLQALRALAAGVVAFRHIGQQLHFHAIGSFGVDIFFVISGFVMAQICESGRTKSFFLRRVARIVPLYWGATLSLFSVAVIAPGLLIETRPNAVYLLLSLLFIPFRKATGQIEPFLFLGWTLNFEMYFYVLLSIGLLLWPKRAVWLTAAMIAAVFLLVTGGSSVFSLFYGDSIVFEFVAGSIVFYMYNAMGHERARRLRFVFIALAVLAMGSIPWPDFLYAIPPNMRGIYLGIPAACLVGSIVGLSRGGFDSPWRWIVLLGDASYVMYLSHPFVEIGLEKSFLFLIPLLTHQVFIMSSLILIGVALASVVIYRTVDLPVQRLLKFGGSKPGSLSVIGTAQ
jgi:exopolysaccharide production protein ExoZ